MRIQNICVVGAGQMGRQIALNAALHGFHTALTDASPEAVEGAAAWAGEYLAGRIAKGRLDQAAVDDARRAIDFTEDMDAAFGGADIVIEAVVEDLEIKRALFARMDKSCPTHTLLASNSSSFCPSKLAPATKRGDRVANMHFFNPALVMELVEVVKGPETSDETARAMMTLSRAFGKHPILLSKEINGFVVNRILGRLFEEACRLIQDGVATPQEIDVAVEKALNHPMGPCKLMDLSGLDTCYLIRVQRYAESQNELDRPPAIMKEMFERGELGRKSGRGFYEYGK